MLITVRRLLLEGKDLFNQVPLFFRSSRLGAGNIASFHACTISEVSFH